MSGVRDVKENCDDARLRAYRISVTIPGPEERYNILVFVKTLDRETSSQGKFRSDRLKRCTFLALAAASLLTGGSVSSAIASITFEASYRISLAGLTIGTATAKSRFTDTTYDAVINGKTSGVSRTVSDAQTTLLGRGRISGKRIFPQTYELETREGEFETHVRMKMRASAISNLLVIPRLRDHPDRVPIEASHKRGVVDPLAAFLLVNATKTTDGSKICQRTVKVFDGWHRYDINLSFKESRRVDGSSDSYDGRVFVCRARYVPVAGHRARLKTTQQLAENERLEVWYAPLADGRLLAPYRILIGTQYGDLVVAATRFVAGDRDTAARGK